MRVVRGNTKSTPSSLDRLRPVIVVRLSRHHRRKDDQHHAGDETAVHAPQRAAGVEPLPEQGVEDRRQVGRCCHREGQRNEERDVLAQRDDAADDRHDADDNRGDARDPPLRRLTPPRGSDFGVDVVRERCCRSNCDRHDREDRRERPIRNYAERDRATDSNASGGPPSSPHRGGDDGFGPTMYSRIREQICRKMPISQIAQTTERRASCDVGTV